MKIQNMKTRFLLLAAMLCFSALVTTAQTTTFSYQGHFTDSTQTNPTNGSYEMQFKLFTERKPRRSKRSNHKSNS